MKKPEAISVETSCWHVYQVVEKLIEPYSKLNKDDDIICYVCNEPAVLVSKTIIYIDYSVKIF